MKLILAITISLSCFNIYAAESTVEKVEMKANEAADGVKKTYRNAKGEICEMINGKVHCVAEKVKEKAKNLGDKIETKSEELKNKAD